jgi:uncharacterized membrane protein
VKFFRVVRKLFFRLHQEASHLRGNEIFRIEALSDAVFAFSVSLLIMSLEIPESFEEFRQTLLNFPSFMATVALVFFFWYHQNTFFRNYGLNSGKIIFLNLSLLVIILFYAFPLKYMFSLLLSWLLGINFFSGEEGEHLPLLTIRNFSELVAFFSTGYSAIWFLFFLMYKEARKMKEILKLTQKEAILLNAEIRDALAQVFIGILGLIFAVIHWPSISGLCFLLIPVWLIINNRMVINQLRKRSTS